MCAGVFLFAWPNSKYNLSVTILKSLSIWCLYKVGTPRTYISTNITFSVNLQGVTKNIFLTFFEGEAIEREHLVSPWVTISLSVLNYETIFNCTSTSFWQVFYRPIRERCFLRPILFSNKCTLNRNLYQVTPLNRSVVLLNREVVELVSDYLLAFVVREVQHIVSDRIALTVLAVCVEHASDFSPFTHLEVNLVTCRIAAPTVTISTAVESSCNRNLLRSLHLHGQLNLAATETFRNLEENLAAVVNLGICVGHNLNCAVLKWCSWEYSTVLISLVTLREVLSINLIVQIPVIFTLDILEREVVEVVSDRCCVISKVKGVVRHISISDGEFCLDVSPLANLDSCASCTRLPLVTSIVAVETTTSLNLCERFIRRLGLCLILKNHLVILVELTSSKVCNLHEELALVRLRLLCIRNNLDGTVAFTVNSPRSIWEVNTICVCSLWICIVLGSKVNLVVPSVLFRNNSSSLHESETEVVNFVPRLVNTFYTDSSLTISYFELNFALYASFLASSINLNVLVIGIELHLFTTIRGDNSLQFVSTVRQTFDSLTNSITFRPNIEDVFTIIIRHSVSTIAILLCTMVITCCISPTICIAKFEAWVHNGTCHISTITVLRLDSFKISSVQSCNILILTSIVLSHNVLDCSSTQCGEFVSSISLIHLLACIDYINSSIDSCYILVKSAIGYFISLVCRFC